MITKKSNKFLQKRKKFEQATIGSFACALRPQFCLCLAPRRLLVNCCQVANLQVESGLQEQALEPQLAQFAWPVDRRRHGQGAETHSRVRKFRRQSVAMCGVLCVRRWPVVYGRPERPYAICQPTSQDPKGRTMVHHGKQARFDHGSPSLSLFHHLVHGTSTSGTEGKRILPGRLGWKSC